MNKEVKELIDRLKDNANSDDYDENGYFFALYISDKDLLLDYINQLKKELQLSKDLQKELFIELQKRNEALFNIRAYIESKPYCTNGDITINKIILLNTINKALEEGGSNE